MIKFCQKCYDNHINEFGCNNGFYWCLMDYVSECPTEGCGEKLLDIDFPPMDLKVLEKVSDNNPSFYKAMIDLHDKDIIEYEIKMSQFRTQVKRQEAIESIQNQIHCPKCGSTDIGVINCGPGYSFFTGSIQVGSPMNILTGFTNPGKLMNVCKNCGY
ncbi:MAG: hypothetical protein ACOYBL_12160, partial [Lachnospiraceae bacterium]